MSWSWKLSKRRWEAPKTFRPRAFPRTHGSLFIYSCLPARGDFHHQFPVQQKIRIAENQNGSTANYDLEAKEGLTSRFQVQDFWGIISVFAEGSDLLSWENVLQARAAPGIAAVPKEVVAPEASSFSYFGWVATWFTFFAHVLKAAAGCPFESILVMGFHNSFFSVCTNECCDSSCVFYVKLFLFCFYSPWGLPERWVSVVFLLVVQMWC